MRKEWRGWEKHGHTREAAPGHTSKMRNNWTANPPPFSLKCMFHILIYKGNGSTSSLKEEDFVELEHGVPPHTFSGQIQKACSASPPPASSHTRGCVVWL